MLKQPPMPIIAADPQHESVLDRVQDMDSRNLPSDEEIAELISDAETLISRIEDEDQRTIANNILEFIRNAGPFVEPEKNKAAVQFLLQLFAHDRDLYENILNSFAPTDDIVQQSPILNAASLQMLNGLVENINSIQMWDSLTISISLRFDSNAAGVTGSRGNKTLFLELDNSRPVPAQIWNLLSQEMLRLNGVTNGGFVDYPAIYVEKITITADMSDNMIDLSDWRDVYNYNLAGDSGLPDPAQSFMGNIDLIEIEIDPTSNKSIQVSFGVPNLASMHTVTSDPTLAKENYLVEGFHFDTWGGYFNLKPSPDNGHFNDNFYLSKYYTSAVISTSSN